MPAMAKLMMMRGPNAVHPCRECKIEGTTGGGKTNYVPIWRSGGASYDPWHLPRRTHDEFITDALSVDSAPNNAEAERRAKATGINGLSVLATLSSLSFPDSFGHDLMHLIPENVVKNLLSLYTSDYKGLDTGSEDYELEPDAVETIGSACVAAGDTTPSAFGARVPNLATQRHYYTAESYTLFSTLLAPVVLRNRFSNAKYYKHFVELVAIFNDCLRMSIDREYVDVVLRRQIVDWVQKFEK
uniref:Uncharacterized protein n=1 Tax=Mycena chlorophos TaxID=658473 RepID=A0ABQ0KUF1_MYCCL|nr:predicted protein [Mycena chlorophos]